MHLTNAEEQVMKLLWKLDKAFIRDLLNEFPDPKPASTTVLTLLKRMIDKGFVSYKQFGNSREYYPLIRKADYFSDHINGLIKDFFNNSTTQFASFFTNETEMSAEELKELREIVDKKIASQKAEKMIAYIIKSSISLILLFGLYWFLLRKEKLFVFNRYFLVLSVIFSLILPFISIPVYYHPTHEMENIIPAHNYFFPEISISENIVSQDININQASVGIQPSVIDLRAILMVIYLSGAILFLLRFLKNIYSIRRKIKSCNKVRLKGYRLILVNEETNPYCFFNNIFINKVDYLNFRTDNQLLNHELEHIKQYHSLDIVFIELIKIFYWFNPVHLLYDRAIRINHEYLADNGVIRYDCDIQSYMNKLISFIIGRSNIPLTSGSNHSFTKKRLLMMTKTKSGSSVYGLRIATALSLILVFSLFISFKQSDKQPYHSAIQSGEITQNVLRGIVVNEDGKPLTGLTITITVSNSGSSREGTDLNGRFTIKNIPVGTPFLIESPGFKSQTLKADFTSEMVVRLIRDPDYKGKILIDVIRNVNFRNSDFSPAKALVVIDGVIIDYKSNLKVNPEEIKSFKVLTDKEATDKYGEKGKDGIAEITLYGNNTGSAGKKQSVSNIVVSDSSKYKTHLDVNHVTNKGEIINIPVADLQYINEWIYHDINGSGGKEFRFINIMTRDYYKIKGTVVRENGKPLSGVKISASENPVIVTSDRKGRFLIEDVYEKAMLEFSLPGYKPYYLMTSFDVSFNMELTIKLEKGQN